MKEDIINELKTKNLTDYQSIPFWSWNNRLEIPELLKQIEDMKAHGMGGFIMHARTGLTTPYLGEEWFKCIEACLDKAKQLSMNAWVYDENGWPSGFVGGELLKKPENLATYLVMEEKDCFDEGAIGNYILENGKFVRLQKARPLMGAVCYSVNVRRSPANTDILNPKVMDQFIALTYEKYYERFKDRFGKELVGFFTDEPQYFRYATPYSVVLSDEYKALYKEDIADGLIHLFFRNKEDYPFRERYYKLLNKVYTRNYYKRLNDWCIAHGCKFTGHTVEETTLSAQMWGCSGCMPSYAYETIPAIDNLGNGFTAKLSGRQLGSVRDQLGFKQTLTETYGCSGYAATPRRLRAIGDGQFVRGVTQMCQHLYSYSLKGQGKMDHPPCFSHHMPWNDEFTNFNNYFTHIGYLLSNSEARINTLVLSAMSSVYLNYKRDDEAMAQVVDAEFSALQDVLKNSGIDYNIGDENLLAEYGKVANKTLTVGKMSYKYIIVPYMLNCYQSTKALLEKFVACGGKVFLYKDAPIYTDGAADDYSFLKTNVTLSEIKEGGAVVFGATVPVEYCYREGKNFKMLYVFNESDKETELKLTGDYALFNPVTLETENVNGALKLGAEESAVLFKDFKADKAVKAFNKPIDITGAFKYVSDGKNTLPVDYVTVSKDGVHFGEKRFCYELLEELIKEEYKGKLWIRYSFDVKNVVLLKLTKEKDNGAAYKFNGREIAFTQSKFDVNFVVADLGGLTKLGENTFEYALDFYESSNVKYALFDPEATESLRNCLVYDTEIEPIYISGDFSVTDNREIAEHAADVKITEIDKQGYKYFADVINFKAEITAEESFAKLKAVGDYMVARVKVNGKPYSIALTDHVTIALEKGAVNTIEIQLAASLRNKFGPFHCTFDDDFGVSPFNYAMRTAWNDGKTPYYTKDYMTKPFGIKKIEIIY